ncbi:MAG: hypothetical protein ACLR56_05740 [Oscillospiraceae bacterium]
MIYKNYSVDDLKNKAYNKKMLLKEMGLPETDAPVIGIVNAPCKAQRA